MAPGENEFDTPALKTSSTFLAELRFNTEQAWHILSVGNLSSFQRPCLYFSLPYADPRPTARHTSVLCRAVGTEPGSPELTTEL